MKNRLAASRVRPQFEELEPRILYSADASAILNHDAITPNAEIRTLDLSSSTANSNNTTQASNIKTEVVFVDTSVTNYQQLINDIKSGGSANRQINIIYLDAKLDGIAQITEALSNFKNLDTVHLISHGSDGNLDIGNNQLNLQTLLENEDAISTWGSAFSENGDFLIYGCNVAETQFGQGFIDYLSNLTQADVAASTDATGSANLSGNWVLEYQSGSIESQVALNTSEQQNWQALLSITPNGTITSANTLGATSLTWSHTVASGTDRAMFVEIAIDGLGANVTSVTYGGVALTQVGRSTGNHAVEIWELTNPLVGTANIVVSFAGTTAAAAGATTYNGVSQTTPFSGYVGASGTGTTSSVTVASATGNLVIDAQYWQGMPLGGAVGAGQTLQWQLQNIILTGGSTTEAGAPSVVMSGDFLSLAQWVIGAVSINAAVAPTITTTSSILTYTENAPATAIDSALVVSDSDSTNLSSASVSISANYNSNQDLLGFTNQNGIVGSWDSITGTLSLSGIASVASYQAALRSVTYLNSSESPNTSTRTVSFLVNDGASNSNTANRNISITAVNDAPILTPRAPVYNTTEGGGAFAVNVAAALGTSVTDVDSGSLSGIAITSITGTSAVVKYSINGGVSYTDVGAVSETNALLLRAQDVMSFTPSSTTGGNVLITYRAWDQTTGTFGTKVDVSINGGTTAFSTNTDTETIQVAYGNNDAPTINVVAPRTTNEDVIKVFSQFIGNAITVSDPDAGTSPLELTVSATNGTVKLGHLSGLTFTIGDGTDDTTMTFTGTLVDINNALDNITYTPTTNYNGAAQLDFSLNDLGNTGTGGAKIATASQLITVLPINDAPSGVTASLFVAISEDTFNSTGKLVSDFTPSVVDPDAGALKGIAVSSADNTNGEWQYTLDGTNWINIGAVSTSNALLLGSDALTRVRFVPNANYNGLVFPFSYMAWDQSSGVAGSYADTSVSGGTSAFSIDSASVSIAVSAVNDAPVLTPYAPVYNTIENGGGFVVSVATVLGSSVTDVDAGALQGIAITGISGTSGTISYSTDGGNNWVDVGSVSETSALLLRATDSVQFTPSVTVGGTMHITYRAWDQTTGSTASKVDVSTNGGTTAFSLNAESVTVNVTSVNDAPAGQDKSITIAEDTIFTFALSDFGFSDIDNNNIDRVYFSTLPSVGTLKWNGNAIIVNDYVIAGDIASGLLTYEPALNNEGAGASSFTFIVQDDGGTANGGANLDPTANTITFDITAVNDAPTLSNIENTDLQYFEGSTTQVSNTITLADVDSSTISSATISLGGYLIGEDYLVFTNTANISGSWDANTGTLTLTGVDTIAAYEQALRSIAYQDVNNDTPTEGNVWVTFSVNDGVDTSNSVVRTIYVNAINDSPTTSPVTLSAIAEDSGARLITQAELLTNAADVDGPSLTATGLSIASGAGSLVDNGNGTWTYTPALNDDTTVSFSYTVTDGSLSAAGSASLDITPVNDAPEITIPFSQGTLPDQPLTFSVANGNTISVADIDASTNLLRLSISVTNGTLTLAQTTGLTFTLGDGTADANLIFDGTLSDINLALDGLIYNPSTGFTGTETINILIDDLGNVGTGGALTASESVAVDVSDNHFLQGNYLEIGINKTGSLGALSGTPTGFVNAGSSLGAIADTGRDGWATYNGDFILPGNPVDEWGVNIGGTTYYNSTSGLVQNITGTAGLTTDNGTTQSLVWSGATSGLNISNSYSVSRTDLFMDMNITLTNTTGSAMTDIYYYRNVDPDNNANSSGDFNTTNTIVSQGDNGSGIAFVSATQADGSFMGLQGFGSNARVSYGGFSNINPIDAYAGANGLSSSGSLLADAGIQIVYKLSLAAGESVTLNLRYVFDSQQAPKLDLDTNDSNSEGSGYQTTYVENAAPVNIVDTDATVKDIDSANLQSMTASITNVFDGANEILTANTTGTLITASYNNGVLTLTGSDTVANYEQVLRTISYANTSENPNATQRIINIVANDGLNNSNIVTSKINVTPVNDAAVITPAAVGLTETDAVLSTAGTLAISDVDSAVTFATQTNVAGSGGYGVFNLAADGSWTYTANTAHNEFVAGTTYTDSLTVSSADGTTSTITVNILGTNDAPTASNTSQNVLEDNVLNGTLPLATDAEGATVNYSLGTTATHGVVTVGVNGAFSYTPNTNYNGLDSFTYVINDGSGGTNTYTVSITVISVNNNPVASDATINAIEDTLYSGTLPSATDIENDPITYSLNTGALHGTVNINTNGTFTYASTANYNGADSFTYTVTDSLGGANTYTITVAIAAVNDAPTASNDSITGLEDSNIVGNVLTNDSDIEGSTLTAILVTGPTNGSLTLNANGSYTYTPNTNWNGTESFSYKANDGTADSNIATITITVTPVNDQPSTSLVTLTAILEDSGAHLITQAQLLANAADVDGDALTAINLAISAGNGVLVNNNDGTWTYTPGANDDTNVSFSYSITDGNLNAAGLVNLDITPVNDAPTANNSNISALENTTTNGTLPTATDVEGNTITYSVNTGAAHGSLVINNNGSFTYTPTAYYVGSDSFTYNIDDGNGGSNTYTVSINSINVNDAPTAANATINVVEDVFYTGTLPNATDLDNDPVSYTLNTGALHGTVVVNTNGNFSYSPTANFNGTDSFTYTISDGQGGLNTYTITININAVNDTPTANNDAKTGLEDNNIVGNVLTNDSDIENSTLSAILVSGPANGSLTLNANGSFVYVPNANWNGTDTFSYQANDGASNSNIATVTFTVTSINDIPNTTTVTLPTILKNSGAHLITQAQLLANATDVDGDTLSVTNLAIALGNGVLVDNNNGTWTYTPGALDESLVSFSYQVTDGSLSALGIANMDIASVIVPVVTPTTPVTPTNVDPITNLTPKQTIESIEPTDNKRDITPPAKSVTPSFTAAIDNNQSVIVRLNSNSIVTTNSLNTRLEQQAASQSILDLINLPNITAPNSVTEVFRSLTHNAQIHIAPIEFIEPKSSPAQLIGKLFFDNKIALTSVAVSAGLVAWAAQYGILFSSVLATLPAWRNLDPVAILGKDDENEETEWDDTDDENDQAAEENAIEILSENVT